MIKNLKVGMVVRCGIVTRHPISEIQDIDYGPYVCRCAKLGGVWVPLENLKMRKGILSI